MEIPKHTKCNNCGGCCGPIMANEDELKAIADYIKTKMPKVYRAKLKAQVKDPLTCQFRDIKNKRCAIYPVRPTLCRLFGVVAGMQCDQGNTSELDGNLFLDRSKKPRMVPIML